MWLTKNAMVVAFGRSALQHKPMHKEQTWRISITPNYNYNSNLIGRFQMALLPLELLIENGTVRSSNLHSLKLARLSPTSCDLIELTAPNGVRLQPVAEPRMHSASLLTCGLRHVRGRPREHCRVTVMVTHAQLS